MRNTSNWKWNEDNALYSFICSWITPFLGWANLNLFCLGNFIAPHLRRKALELGKEAVTLLIFYSEEVFSIAIVDTQRSLALCYRKTLRKD